MSDDTAKKNNLASYSLTGSRTPLSRVTGACTQPIYDQGIQPLYRSDLRSLRAGMTMVWQA